MQRQFSGYSCMTGGQTMGRQMDQRQQQLHAILTAAPLVPVLTIEDRKAAVPLAKALVSGGLTALEVTLRTSAALDAIRAIAAEVPEANVGAGTVLDIKQFEDSAKAGATFIVSPGATPKLVAKAAGSEVPYLPGVNTAGEAMSLAEQGFSTLKFFPAEPSGGLDYLRALVAPLPDIRFCPTGGISLANASNYLALPNVICVGGTWVATPALQAGGEWARITALSREAAGLRAA